jgi:methylglutaconyl-CoA hydratase
VATAKALIREGLALPRDAAIEFTARTIARVRVSPEGQEGLAAFLEKRKPRWS